ncbi:hypothetical protein [Congregibacter litoralis]|uniref:Uncharacterized protein n=1 Tax=Congregibacter litoralis KT71 TaxID=314285 RepID=A4AEB0_9GAMM|nr:hypothetical protein [Congregibacter litoralis]EAQ95664.2 hypothetical protein KT71_13729 [Congregibacter litoralis KT71]
MSGDDLVPRPETLALTTWIRAVLDDRTSECRPSASGNTLFLAFGLHTIPASLVCDAVLDPVDKLVWQVIFLAGVEAGGWGTFPSYKAINASANVGSSATVSRALAMLRLTRWLTSVTHDQGPTMSGSRSVQALHDAPLCITDTLFLDPGYVDYVSKSRTHHHARVRALSAEIYDAFETGRNSHSRSVMLEARSVLADWDAERSGSSGSFFDATDSLRKSKSRSSSSKQQGFKTVKKTIKKTTTTRGEQPSRSSEREAVDLQKLSLPSRLTTAQHPTVARYLATVFDRDRQAVLDELAGRLNTEGNGADPVYDALRYLYGLCQRARQGHFVPNLGVVIRKAREQRQSASNPAPLQPPTPEPAEPVDREAGLRTLAALRTTLGMSVRVNSPSDSRARSLTRRSPCTLWR